MSCNCEECGGTGLNGLMGATENCGGAGLVPAGSVFRVGFRFGSITGSNITAEELTNIIEGCLYESGSFAEIYVEYTSGWFSNYVKISGRTAIDFGDRNDIGGFIVQVLGYCYQPNAFVKPDPTCIDAIPQDRANEPNVVRPGAPDYRGDRQPIKCNLDAGWSNYLACQLGVTPSSAAMVGVVGALVGVILISKLAR